MIQFLLFPAVSGQKHLNPCPDRRLGNLKFSNVMLGEHNRHGGPGLPFLNQHEAEILGGMLGLDEAEREAIRAAGGLGPRFSVR